LPAPKRVGRSADPALQPPPLAGLDETANAEILGQFVPSLATMPEIQVQRNARVIQVRKRDLPRSWDALPLAASEIAGVPSLWATAKAAERWLVKNPPEAQRDIIRFLPWRMVDKKSSTIVTVSSGGEQIDDLLNGLVGAVVGGFELAGRLVLGVGAVVEAAVGEWAAKPFVEEQKEQGNLNPFGGETVGVAGTVALQQAVPLELA